MPLIINAAVASRIITTQKRMVCVKAPMVNYYKFWAWRLGKKPPWTETSDRKKMESANFEPPVPVWICTGALHAKRCILATVTFTKYVCARDRHFLTGFRHDTSNVLYTGTTLRVGQNLRPLLLGLGAARCTLPKYLKWRYIKTQLKVSISHLQPYSLEPYYSKKICIFSFQQSVLSQSWWRAARQQLNSWWPSTTCRHMLLLQFTVGRERSFAETPLRKLVTTSELLSAALQ